MLNRFIAALAICGLVTLSACALEDDSFIIDETVVESQSALEVVGEAVPLPGECVASVEPGDVDVEPIDCGDRVVCSCDCNGVAVNVTIHTEIHGETCADVNGRPCNTGNGWSTYTGCDS